jgi:histidinol phosphatase-like enzyme (inositol monophosphatase family)
LVAANGDCPLFPVSEIGRRLELALTAAREAGRITLKFFRRPGLQVERKRDDSPVTQADREAEEHLRRRIAENFPEDAILGEELPDRPGASGFRWILDPIDGTKSFIHGVPLYSTLIGVEHEGQSILGVIVVPAMDEGVYAARGQGAWYFSGGEPPLPARVSSCPKLGEGLFLTSEVGNFEAAGRRDVYDRLQSAARLSRTWGDGYGYMMVATGRAELMVDPIMCVWDAAPMVPILEEAGGKFTDWQGRPTIHSGQGIAANPSILEEALGITRG